MLYDDIFEKPISEYSDDEIRSRALELRSKAKLTKKKAKSTKVKSASSTAKINSTHSSPKDKIADMLEQAMTAAKTK